MSTFMNVPVCLGTFIINRMQSKWKDHGQVGDRGGLAQKVVEWDPKDDQEATVAAMYAVGAQQGPPHVAPPPTPNAMFAAKTGAAALPAPHVHMGGGIAMTTVNVLASCSQ